VEHLVQQDQTHPPEHLVQQEQQEVVVLEQSLSIKHLL
jgi:hypothetical protein